MNWSYYRTKSHESDESSKLPPVSAGMMASPTSFFVSLLFSFALSAVANTELLENGTILSRTFKNALPDPFAQAVAKEAKTIHAFEAVKVLVS